MSEQLRGRDPHDVLVLDPASAAPPFRQLHDAVARGISDGALLPGQKLPTVRALAGRLGIAVNTVASAYRSLEEARLVEGRGRAGTFVALGDDPVAAAALGIALEAVARLRELGLDSEAAERVFAQALATGAPPR
ncbi:MAG: GntR family transcriptional regulator [Leucobacter sp.]